jgi:hypothetical protein
MVCLRRKNDPKNKRLPIAGMESDQVVIAAKPPNKGTYVMRVPRTNLTLTSRHRGHHGETTAAIDVKRWRVIRHKRPRLRRIPRSI